MYKLVATDNDYVAPDNNDVDLRATDCARSQTNEFVVDDYELDAHDACEVSYGLVSYVV